MAGDSILQYNKKAPTGTTSGQRGNNFNRNHEATLGPMYGWKGQIFNYSNQNYGFFPVTSTDPILNSLGSNRTSTVDKITNVFTVATGLVGLVITASQIPNAVKTLKSDDNKDANEDGSSSLSNLTEQATNCKKKDRTDVSTKLGDAIKTATTELNDAKCTKTSSQRTYDENKSKYDEKVSEHETFKSEKLALQEEISTMESSIRTQKGTLASKKLQLASMKPEDEGYVALKAEVEKLEKDIETAVEQLKQLEERLKDDYSTEKENRITDLMAHYKSEMEAAKNKIDEADEKIKKLDKEIKDATKAKKELDAKISQDNN